MATILLPDRSKLPQESELSDEERSTLKKMKDSIRISTANGIIPVEWEADVWVDALEIWVRAIVLESAPWVLSLSAVVDDRDMDCAWRSKKHPFLLRADGRRFYCDPSMLPF